LKGKSTAIDVYRLIGVRERPDRSHSSPFVGRTHELSLLREAWERTRREQRCELVTIVGDAGIGKSRLVAEFLREVDANVVHGRALPYGEGITYWPVVEVLEQVGSGPTAEAEAALRVLLGDSADVTSAEEIAWAVRRTLEHAAAQRPLVVVFDDIQWAEDIFLDLVEQLVLLSVGATILVLCMARSELVERRPTWQTTFRLQPLLDGDIERLVPAHMSARLRREITRTASGNPLFAHEMVAVAGEGDEEVVVPPTLQALLAARLDQLEPRERRALECASVEGEIFHSSAVRALVPSEPNVTSQVTALARKQLIRPENPEVGGEEAFRFAHLLIRDAAYDGLPKATRSDLHQRFVDWLETQSLAERDEIAGYHLERAVLYREELGSPDQALAEAAAERLGAAARSALHRGDWTASRSLSRRAVQLLPELNALRLEVLRTYVFAFWDVETGRLAREAIDELRRSDDERAVAYGSMFSANLDIFQGGGGSAQRLEEASDHARVTFERLGDETGLAYAYLHVGLAKWVRGLAADATAAWERALEHARPAQAGRVENECRALLVKAYLFGPTRVSEAIEYCERRLLEFRGRALIEADIKMRLANLYAMHGALRKARELLGGLHDFWTRAGLEPVAGATRMTEARVEWYGGDIARAEEFVRAGLAELEQLEDRGYAGTTALELAGYLEEQEKLDEAELALRRARELTNVAEVFDAVGLDAVEARLLARRGLFEQAEALGRRARTAADSTDLYFAHVAAASSLAQVLEAAGRAADACTHYEYALAAAESKEDLVYAGLLRARLEQLEPVAGSKTT
jgi:ATP/maltotriose-dependent transcriptional regulator MalT